MTMSRPSTQNSPEQAFEELFDRHNGLLTLRGSLVELRRRLDALFREWATVVHAEEYAFPPLMSVPALASADYFSAFPHLAVLASRIEPTDEGIARFVETTKDKSIEEIGKENLAPARFVFPSAACYAVYHHFHGARLDGDRCVTLMSPCFRHETSYTAGQRQWSFQMREIVCVGSEESAQKFLETYRQFLTGKLQEAGLSFTLAEATDPFFDKRDPRRLLQRLEPLKHEFLFDNRLAIASVNYHRKFFGERFNLREPSGEPAHSACVAFGLERWLYACLRQFGSDWEAWPSCLKPASLSQSP